MKKILLFLFSILVLMKGYSFGHLRTGVENKESVNLYPNLLLMIIAIILLSIIITILTRFSSKVYSSQIETIEKMKKLSSIPLTTASIVLGMGFGGFINTAILHQVLQWLGMLSIDFHLNVEMDKYITMLWGCIFRCFMLITSILGIYLIWKLLQKENINRSGYLLSGGILVGWGLFNLAEGIIDLRILKLGILFQSSPNPNFWRYVFLVFGFIMIVIGYYLVKKGEKNAKIA